MFSTTDLKMGIAVGRKAPGEARGRRELASPRPTAEGRSSGRTAPNNGSFPASSGTRPLLQSRRRQVNAKAQDPAPREAPPPDPTGPASLAQGFSGFWRQISIGYFPLLFGDATGGVRHECGDSRGIKAHRRARAPPPRG